MGQLRDKVVSGAFWVTIERFATQAVDFIVGVVLARLLGPADFGTVALTGIFFAIARSLIDSGLGVALVQRKDTTDLDFNTVFYTSIALSLFAYAVLFFAAPGIAAFYHAPELVPIVRVSAISLIFFGINSVQTAELERKMLFNLQCRVTLIICIFAGVTGITLAHLGFGVWALVWSGVLTAIVGTVARWFIIAWRPRLEFSFTRLKGLFSFGWKICVAGVIERIFEQLRGLLIGRFYQRTDLAFVDKGDGLPQRVSMSINDTLSAVSLPALVRLQDEPDRMREAMRRMIRASNFLVIPAMSGVGYFARPLILLLFGDKWAGAVPYMYIACFSYALYPCHMVNMRGIMAKGRGDIFLNLQIIKKVVAIVAMFVSIHYGVLVFVMTSAFVLGPFNLLVSAWPNRKLLGYSIRMQVMDVLPTVLLSGVMLTAVFGMDRLLLFCGLSETNLAILLRLFVGGVLGAVVYLASAFVFKVSALDEYRDVLLTFASRLKKAFGRSV